MNKIINDMYDAHCITDEDEPYDPNESRMAYIERVVDDGMVVIFPNVNELLVDMDTEEQYEVFTNQIRRLSIEYDLEYKVYPSKSGFPRRHAVVTMPFAMDDMERIAWQGALGSDPIREMLSLFRLKRGDKHPTIFVEREDQ